MCDISHISFSHRLYIYHTTLIIILRIARTAGNKGYANKEMAIKDDGKWIHTHKE